MREMKDSGIEWIGEIPKEWNIIPTKYCFTVNNGSDPTTNDGDTPVYGSGSKSFKTCIEFKEGPTVLLGRKGTVNIPQWIDGRYWNVDTAFDVKPKGNYSLKFFFYTAICFDYENYSTQTALPSMTQGNYLNIKLPYMSLSDQYRIVNFLDAKCAEIDALTADIQTQIDILEQYKRSVITEAVTKGLNTDAETKNSGIEWIGEIPATWNIHPVYSYFGERKSKNSLGNENNLLSLSYGRVIRKDINANGGLLPESFNTYNIVEADDIIIRPTDLQNDKRSLRTGLVKEHGIITSAYIDLCPIKHVDSRYFHYLLHAYDVMKVFYNMGNGVRQGLNYSEFSKLMVFEPSYAEQVSIANYLDKKCTEINACIDDKQRQLEVLEEYKKSLIYEYVTGKKEVPANA